MSGIRQITIVFISCHSHSLAIAAIATVWLWQPYPQLAMVATATVWLWQHSHHSCDRGRHNSMTVGYCTGCSIIPCHIVYNSQHYIPNHYTTIVAILEIELSLRKFHSTRVPYCHSTIVPVPHNQSTRVPYCHSTIVPKNHTSALPWYHSTTVPYYHTNTVP